MIGKEELNTNKCPGKPTQRMIEGIIDRINAFYSSDNGRLTLCAVCASIVTAATIYSAQFATKQSKSKKSRLEALKHAAEEHDHIQLTDYGGPQRRQDIGEDIIREQLSRNYLFFGDSGMERIRSSFVVVVGVGGVGSWATVMLVRTGIKRIRIIDFDQVTLSSLNRHASATLHDVGTPKVDSLKSYLAKIAPWVEIDTRNELFQKSDAETLLEDWDGQKPDFVVDAIDNIETKCDLLEFCHTRQMPVISAMGAGCKSDPTRICVTDISETSEDALSRATRRGLRIRGISSGIITVWSTETPGQATLKPLSDDQVTDRNELSVLPDFRARILPVLGTMPGIFGLTIATHVLCRLAQYPTPQMHVKRQNLITVCAEYTRFMAKYDKDGFLPSRAEVGFLVDEVFNGSSVLPPYKHQKLGIVKWDPSKFGGLGNLVVMTKPEIQQHELKVFKEGKVLLEVYSLDEIKHVESLLCRYTKLQHLKSAASS